MLYGYSNMMDLSKASFWRLLNFVGSLFLTQIMSEIEGDCCKLASTKK